MTDKLGTGSVYPAPRVDVTAYPTLECFTKAHTGAFFFGFIGVAFNFFVCPIFLFYRLGLSLLEEKMSEQDSLRSFGDFYGMYERKYWWWHAVVILRRWFFILTCSLLSPIGYFQVSSGRVSGLRATAHSSSAPRPLSRLVFAHEPGVALTCSCVYGDRCWWESA